MSLIIPKKEPKPVEVGSRPKPVTVDPTKDGGAYWGKIVGDIHSQADLMLMFQNEVAARNAAIEQAKEDLLPLIYAGL